MSITISSATNNLHFQATNYHLNLHTFLYLNQVLHDEVHSPPFLAMSKLQKNPSFEIEIDLQKSPGFDRSILLLLVVK